MRRSTMRPANSAKARVNWSAGGMVITEAPAARLISMLVGWPAGAVNARSAVIRPSLPHSVYSHR